MPDNDFLSGRHAEAAKMLDTSIDSSLVFTCSDAAFLREVIALPTMEIDQGACHFVALKTSFGPGAVMDSRKVPLRCFKNQ